MEDENSRQVEALALCLFSLVAYLEGNTEEHCTLGRCGCVFGTLSKWLWATCMIHQTLFLVLLCCLFVFIKPKHEKEDNNKIMFFEKKNLRGAGMEYETTS